MSDLDDRDSGGDGYSRWYRQDAARVLQTVTYEAGYHHHRRIKVVCSILKRLSVRKVVDLGCGDGWQMSRFVQAGFDVVGLDIAPQRLQRARRFCPDARGFVAADLRQVPLVRDRIECVYLGQVIEHLPDPVPVLESLRAVLRPGGYLVLDTPCRDNLVDDLIRWTGLSRRYPAALDWSLELDPGHLHFLWLRELVELLRQAGLEFVCSRGAPQLRWNTPRVGNFLAGSRRLWRVHDAVEALLACIPRYRRAGAVVVCVARRPLN